AQVETPTPVQLQFPEATPTEMEQLSPTPTRTATVVANNFVEALSDETNVRAGPYRSGACRSDLPRHAVSRDRAALRLVPDRVSTVADRQRVGVQRRG